jgi:hypothetical protein
MTGDAVVAVILYLLMFIVHLPLFVTGGTCPRTGVAAGMAGGTIAIRPMVVERE